MQIWPDGPKDPRKDNFPFYPSRLRIRAPKMRNFFLRRPLGDLPIGFGKIEMGRRKKKF
jgi:hypothetical protein